MENKLRLDIPFVKQMNSCTCGAACLQMLYSYYGIHCSQQDIFRSIQAPNQSASAPYCALARMIDYSNNLGIPCAGVVPKEPAAFLNFCLKSNINIILLYHRDEDSPLGHFGVLTGIANNRLYINDPFLDDGRNKAYLSGGFVTHHMKAKDLYDPNGKLIRKDDIGHSYSMLLLIPPTRRAECIGVHCENCDSNFPIMSSVASKIDLILCPKEDTWKPLH